MSSARVPMTMSGFCHAPGVGSHEWCRTHDLRCTCICHTDPSAVAEEEERLVALAAGYSSESDSIPAGESGKGKALESGPSLSA